MTTFRITVTQADIDAGKRECAQWCPIALALRRLTPETDIEVDSTLIRVGWESATPPESAAKFIVEYDEWGPREVAPLTFDLEVLGSEES